MKIQKIGRLSRLQMPSANSYCLLHTCYQALKVLLFHSNSSLNEIAQPWNKNPRKRGSLPLPMDNNSKKMDGDFSL